MLAVLSPHQTQPKWRLLGAPFGLWLAFRVVDALQRLFVKARSKRNMDEALTVFFGDVMKSWC
ncbi:MAG: hypothetical protein ACI81R_002024 [Bradymonadia bacterium]|jgi:hypothetical protein